MVDREFELGICAEWNWRKLSEQDSGRKVWVEKLVHIKQDGPASVLMQPRTPKLSGTCKCTVSKPHPKPKRCSLKVLRSESLAAQIPKSVQLRIFSGDQPGTHWALFRSRVH